MVARTADRAHAGRRVRELNAGAAAPWSRWLAAALMLFGVTVTAAVMWTAPAERVDDAQEPVRSLPPEVRAEGKAAIEALPIDTLNLAASLDDPREISAISRFPGLRKLHLVAERVRIGPVRTKTYHTAWSKPPADLLQPVAALREIESLYLTGQLMVSPTLLAPFAGHPAMQRLCLEGESVRLDEAFVAALGKLPKLRTLHVHMVPIDADAMRRLANLSLATIEVSSCPGMDAEVWKAMCSLRSLQGMLLIDHGRRHLGAAGNAGQPWRPDAGALRELGQLQHLSSLEFRGSDLRDDDLAALPDTLRELRLHAHELTPIGFRHLRRLGALHTLAVSTRRHNLTLAGLYAQPPDSNEAADAIAEAVTTLRLQQLDYEGAVTEALGRALAEQPDLVDLRASARNHTGNADVIATALATLRLHRLRYDGPITGDLCRAIAKQPQLTDLELTAERIDSLEGLGDAPVLQRLQLAESGIGDGIAEATLTPLRSCRSLRELDIHVSVDRATPGQDQEALQQLFGANVRVRLHRNEFTIKK